MKKKSINIMLLTIIFLVCLSLFLSQQLVNVYGADTYLPYTFFNGQGGAAVSTVNKGEVYNGNVRSIKQGAANYVNETQAVIENNKTIDEVYTGASISGANGATAIYKQPVNMYNSNLNEPFIELYMPTVDSETNAGFGGYVTLTSIANPAKKITVSLRKRDDSKVLTAQASAYNYYDRLSAVDTNSATLKLTEAFSTSQNIGYMTDGTAPSTSSVDENNVKLTVNKPFGLYFEQFGAGERKDYSIYTNTGRKMRDGSYDNMRVNIGGSKPYRYVVRSLSYEYDQADLRGIPLELTEEEASAMELSVTILNITPPDSGSDDTAEVLITSVKGISLQGDENAFTHFSAINGVRVTGDEGSTVQFSKSLYLGDNNKMIPLAELLINPSTPGTIYEKDGKYITEESYQPDFEKITLNFSSASTSLNVVIDNRGRTGDCFMTIKAGGQGQQILGEKSDALVTGLDIDQIPLDTLSGELPLAFDGFARSNFHQTQYGSTLTTPQMGLHNAVRIFYDAQENALYTDYGRPDGPKIDIGNNLFRWRIRDFDTSYVNGGDTSTWQGFGNEEVNLSIKVEGVVSGRQADYTVLSLDGQKFYADSEGYLVEEAAPSGLISKNNSAYISMESEIPSLGNHSVINGFVDNEIQTSNYYVKVTGPEGNENIMGLSSGKWTEGAYFVPEVTGDYFVQYFNNLEDLEPAFESIITVNNITDKLSVNYNLGKLDVSLDSAAKDMQYQYWIKTVMKTDNEDNLENYQSIWQLAREFSNDSGASISVNDDNLISDGYNIILRMKSKSGIITETHKSCYPHEINQVKIESVSIDGNTKEPLYIVDKSKGSVNVKITANNNEDVTYALYNGENLIALPQLEDGEFNLDLALIGEGNYIIKVEADNGNSIDEKLINIYVVGEYKADEIIVINDLTGVTEKTGDDAGKTTFTVELQYADGVTEIDEDILTIYNIEIYSDGIEAIYIEGSARVQGNVLLADYIVDYNGLEGIYYTTAKVSRPNITGYDDLAIRYYSGYAREAELQQTAEGKGVSFDIANNWYTAEKETQISISAEGSIKSDFESENTVNEADLRYAYFREDASGWVLIKDYSADSTLIWAPIKSGLYNIQVRIKDSNAGSYECTKSTLYKISDSSLEGGLSINIYDNNKDIADPLDLCVGSAFNIAALYVKTPEEIENNTKLFYRFTVYSANTGTIYLNSFSTASSIMFVPKKQETYILSVRIISTNSYGFKDLDYSVVINCQL